MERTRIEQIAGWIERGLIVVGACCLIWAGTISMDALVYQVEQDSRFERPGGVLERRAASGGSPDAGAGPHATPAPIGRLEIPRLGLAVVVAEGDDERTLDVAVGHLPDTPLPWQAGNVALAGHRDTFFRPLRYVRTGDEIRFTTPHGTFLYRVTRQTVVEPHELWVLDPLPRSALTLITCYPFDFVGPAPRRFVVQGERVDRPNPQDR